MERYRIMIVDDEADVREGIVAHIDWDALGFEVVAQAVNGLDALDKVENCEIDVVLTDIKMPFMDGLTMCEKLVQLHPAVKLVFLTGFDDFEYAKAAIRLGTVEYVLKPVNGAELTDVLQRVRNLLDDGVAQKRNIEALRANYLASLPLMRERFLNELLWGTVQDEAIDKQMIDYDLGIRGKSCYVVVAFEVRRDSKDTPIVSWELAPVSIREIIKEYLEKRCACEIMISSSAIIAVTAWDTASPIGDLMFIVNEICAECMRVLHIEVTAGVGSCKPSAVELHESYAQARNALEYRAVVGGGQAIYIEDMEREKPESLYFSSRSEQMLLSAIKFGSPEQIEMLIGDILGRAEAREPWEQQLYLLSMFNAVLGIIQRYDLHSDQAVQESARKLMCLPEHWKAGGDTGQRLCEICLGLSARISEQRETATKVLAESAKHFIDENYQDSGLSVERLCEHLHISQSYFSTVFRQETGQSYVQYLTEIRMTTALRLLQETDDKTYMIAHKVGYEDPNYFSHVFKKRFGISPVKYRSQTAEA